jgi:hypothetical protein
MTSSAAAASGSGSSGEQQAGQLEQMSVNDLQELLANPVLVSPSMPSEITVKFLTIVSGLSPL